jgi:hypothetical protein
MTLDTVNNVNHKRITSPHEAFYSGVKLATVEGMAKDHVVISDVMVPVAAVEKLLGNEGKAVKRAFRQETAEKILAAVKEIENRSEKTAAVITHKLAELSVSQRKELLNVLTVVA